MEVTKGFAGSRMKERLFVMWQEAGGDPGTAYKLWHKVRPLVLNEAQLEADHDTTHDAASQKTKR